MKTDSLILLINENIKDELQHIILGDEQSGTGSALKKAQTFLRGYTQAGFDPQKQQYLKSKEAETIVAFANAENLFYGDEISESDFISEGAEQKVYRLSEFRPLTRLFHLRNCKACIYPANKLGKVKVFT